MSKNSNRQKQYKLQRDARRNKLVRTKRNIATPTATSRRNRRTTQLIKNELSQIASQQRSTRYYQPTARSKKTKQKRSERPSRRRVNVTKRTAQLRSVQNAFKSMGVSEKITTRNYQHYFKLLDDAKITGGNRYKEVLRIASEVTELDDYEGRLFDLVIGKMNQTVL